MWHLDIPSESELRFLATISAPAVVSIYLPTTAISKDAAADAIALRNRALLSEGTPLAAQHGPQILKKSV